MNRRDAPKKPPITELYAIYSVNLEGEKSFFAGFIEYEGIESVDWDKVGTCFYATEEEAISVIPEIIRWDIRTQPTTIFVGKVEITCTYQRVHPRDRNLRGVTSRR